MKTKKFAKKLEMNKRTIANLNSTDMSMLRGGSKFTNTCDTEHDLSCGDASCQPDCWTSNNPRATCETNEEWCV